MNRVVGIVCTLAVARGHTSLQGHGMATVIRASDFREYDFRKCVHDRGEDTERAPDIDVVPAYE